MDRASFLLHVDNLQTEICEAVHAYCQTHGLDLDWHDYLERSGQDIDSVARDILFHGVGVLPEPEIRQQLPNSA